MKRFIVLVTVLLLAQCATADAQSDGPMATPFPLEGDRAVVYSIVMDAVSAVKMCELAAEKSQNTEVRSMCRKATADDARAALAGLALEQKLGAVGVGLQASPQTPGVLNGLAKYSGRDFDQAFLLAQIEDDTNDVSAIRYAVEFAADPSVKRYERSMLPTFEKQLDLAESALRGVSEAAP